MTDDVNAALEKSMSTLLTLSEVQYKMALSVTEDAVMSPTQAEVLCRAAKRPRGNIFPMNGLRGAIPGSVLNALVRQGWASDADGAWKITDLGRAAIEARS